MTNTMRQICATIFITILGLILGILTSCVINNVVSEAEIYPTNTPSNIVIETTPADIIKPTTEPDVTENVSTAPTASPTITEYITPIIRPTATPKVTPSATKIPPATDWFNIVLTVYSNSHNPNTPHGCKNDIPLVEGWSCASFSPEFFTRETELSMVGITELPYGTIIEIDAKDMGGYTGYYIICDTTNSTKIWNERWHDINSKYVAKNPKSWIDMYDTKSENQNVKGLARIRVIKWGDGETYMSKEEFLAWYNS